MALADSLVFPDLVISVILMAVILILAIYLTGQLMTLSIIDYKAAIGTYLFTECQLGNFTGITNFNHVLITNGVKASDYLIICPRITVNGTGLAASVYAAYAR